MVFAVKRERSALKGTEKRVLQIKGTKSALFEEAYFILKPSESEPSENDMVKEAERLLRTAVVQKKRRRFFFGWDDVLVFFSGVLLSFVIFGIALLFL